jgi:uncharacterized membrane protein YoaK (UPF0700 family)
MRFDVRALALILSLIAGSTDTVSFLDMNGLFTAQITGNFVMLAAHLVTRNSATVAFMLALPVFMLVVLLTSLFASLLQRAAVPTLRPLLSLELVLLATFLAISVGAHPRFDVDSGVAIVTGMFGVAAMAVQSALVQISLINTPSTVVMTTNMTHLVVAVTQIFTSSELSATEKARGRLAQLLPVIIGFAVGCAVGAALNLRYGLGSLVFPTALTLVAWAIRWPQPTATALPSARRGAAAR